MNTTLAAYDDFESKAYSTYTDKTLRLRLRRWVGLAFVLFEVIPIASAVYHSFTDWTATGRTPRWLGLANYNERVGEMKSA